MIKYTYCFTGYYTKWENMDLLFGIIIGAVLCIIVGLALYAVWRDKRREANELYGTTPKPKKLGVYDGFVARFSVISTRDEYTSLHRDVNAAQSDLGEKNYNRLVELITRKYEELDFREEALAKAKQRLGAFQAIRTITGRDDLFRELHRIYTGNEGVITYEDLEEFAEDSDLEWYNQTYVELLEEHFRTLLVNARNGTIADYQKVMAVDKQLEDLFMPTGEDWEDFATKRFANEWNEMIVRFQIKLTWSNDLLGLYDLKKADYREIFRKAREEHDFLSLRLSAFFIEEEDSDFLDILVESIAKELQTELSDQYLILGFKPGSEERTN